MVEVAGNPRSVKEYHLEVEVRRSATKHNIKPEDSITAILRGRHRSDNSLDEDSQATSHSARLVVDATYTAPTTYTLALNSTESSWYLTSTPSYL